MAKKQRRKTRDCLRRHALKRLGARYDLYINNEEYEFLCGLCRTGKAKLIDIESNNIFHYLIDGHIIAVYNRKLKAIATFLPDTAIWNYL